MQLIRLQDDGSSTIGNLSINGEFECFTLEDTFNDPKIYGKTRIPAGKYDIKLRKEGSMHGRYSNKFGSEHKGMIWLQDVPDYEWVYIHIGNNEEHTDGCILVGKSCDSKTGTIGNSTEAYKDLNSKITDAIDRGEEITIDII